MIQEQIPVLIIGAGGAGLSLSLFLQQQGVSSLLIERRTDISWYPRARNLNFRSLEVFRGLGLEAEVMAAGSRVTRMFSKESLAASEEKELLDPSLLAGHLEVISPEPLAWYCPQSQLEPVLRAEATRRGVDVRYGTELLSFTQDEQGVTATIKNGATGEVSEVRSQYLVAADGAHSRVREALAIPTKGIGELPEHYIFVYFKANWGELVQGYETDAIMITNEQGHGMFLVTDHDRGMFVITATGPAQEYTTEYCREKIIAALGKADLDVEVVDIARWQPIQRLAERFQQGRVFLVGDAAHTMPPKLGLGVNTAIQSAHNLAWKLAAVLKGSAEPALLETYQTERQPVGWLAVEQSFTGPAAALFEKEFQGAAGQPEQPQQKQLPIPQIIIGYRYHSQAVFAQDNTALLPYEIDLIDPAQLNGQPGTRVPHLWVEREGQRISTLDLLDGRFVLLTGTDSAAWSKAAAGIAAKMGIALASYSIGEEATLRNLEQGWQTKLGLSSTSALLLRPDGFVAWRTSTLPTTPESQLEQVFAHILCRDNTSKQA